MSAAAGDWLSPAETTTSGLPVLLPGELDHLLLPSVDLIAEENPSLPSYLNRRLHVTSHRLVFLSHDSASSPSAGAVPLSGVVHVFPPSRSHRLFSSSSSQVRIQASLPAIRRSEVFTVVVKGKSDAEAFYGRVIGAVRERVWEVVGSAAVTGTVSRGGSSQAVAEPVFRMPVVGVAGILRKEQESWENTDKTLHEAFQDLNALMGKAKEMVQLADRMRQKLLSNSTSQLTSGDEEMGSKQDMQDWLLSVGFISPVTKESAGALYHQQLSRQLADFVRVPLERAGGMIALVDVYCLYNRARGTELISPEDLLQACSLWEKIDVPVMLRTFESGVKVIQTKSHSDEEVFARISSLAQNRDALQKGISPSEAALTLGVAPALAKEHLLSAESKGLLCRDVSADGFRFYINIFKDIDIHNIYETRPHNLYHAWVSAVTAAV